MVLPDDKGNWSITVTTENVDELIDIFETQGLTVEVV